MMTRASELADRSIIPKSPKIGIIGLGYVGLPLAVAFARHHTVIGYDIDETRIDELARGYDRTKEVSKTALQGGKLKLTSNADDLAEVDVFILAIPTPIDSAREPDLSILSRACQTVGEAIFAMPLERCPTVVIESTVYPGVTEDICGPEIERASRRKAGEGFFLGYSPERINPGDKEHSLSRVIKVVAGQCQQVADELARLYERGAGVEVFIARDIRTAEAAKAIENAQRDLNIAFINEIAMIFERGGLSVYDVLEAAQTKWNFLPFQPGLVGGHCIGVDPYYLTCYAKSVGHRPETILAGRRINDNMGTFIAQEINEALTDGNPTAGKPTRILVLGLTFKEDVPDIRNTKVIDVVRGLEAFGHSVDVHDPLADPEYARATYGVDLISLDDTGGRYDCVIGAVPHNAFRKMSPRQIFDLLTPGGLLADIKGIWRTWELPDGLRSWTL